MTRLQFALACLACLAALTLLAACTNGDDGGSGDDATPTAEPTAAPMESPTPTSAQQAVVDFVQSEGLGGETYPFADEVNCRAYTESEALTDLIRGSACIAFDESVFDETEGSMSVHILGADGAWDVALELQGASWVATGATPREQ